MEKTSLRTTTNEHLSDVIIASLKVSFVVGSLLAIINHGPELFQLSLSRGAMFQIALTYLVPFCVAAYSSAKAIQKHGSQENS